MATLSRPNSEGLQGTRVWSESAVIHASDIMTARVVTVTPEASIHDVAELLHERKLNSVPVLQGRALVGIVSAGDLICREELGTATEALGPSARSNWGPSALPEAAKARGAHASDVMSEVVATVPESASLAEIVNAMLASHVRQVPVMRDSKLVGIVSQSDIVRALAQRPPGSREPLGSDDDIIRYHVIETLVGIPGTSPWATTVTVSCGVVELNGMIEDELAKEPSRLAVEGIPHVARVEDYRAIINPWI